MLAVSPAGVYILPSGEVDFGGQHQFIAVPGSQFPQDLFGAPAGVAIRAVVKIDPNVATALVDGRGSFLVRFAAKEHGTQAKLGYLYTGVAQ